ncbi:hypothetical protein G7Y89_g11602 [Cudoniella acicularis]|uniref:Uncharacterized protein n=1 Tax=Cudoniella acicularis TaxID=354080 RepID=A0A8H4RBP1_9HELO|nr:hypothetical protein G7Y89_g11602 [Cudoniella acicularis]
MQQYEYQQVGSLLQPAGGFQATQQIEQDPRNAPHFRYLQSLLDVKSCSTFSYSSLDMSWRFGQSCCWMTEHATILRSCAVVQVHRRKTCTPDRHVYVEIPSAIVAGSTTGAPLALVKLRYRTDMSRSSCAAFRKLLSTSHFSGGRQVVCGGSLVSPLPSVLDHDVKIELTIVFVRKQKFEVVLPVCDVYSFNEFGIGPIKGAILLDQGQRIFTCGVEAPIYTVEIIIQDPKARGFFGSHSEATSVAPPLNVVEILEVNQKSILIRKYKMDNSIHFCQPLPSVSQSARALLLPAVPSAFIVVKDVSIILSSTVEWDSNSVKDLQQSMSAGGEILCFSYSKSESSSEHRTAASDVQQDQKMSIKIPAPQIIDWIQELTPVDEPQSSYTALNVN